MLAEVRIWRTKEAALAAMQRRFLDAHASDTSPMGVYVLMRPDGRVDGFVPTLSVRAYLAHKMSMEITEDTMNLVTTVCGLAASLIQRVPAATPELVLFMACAARGRPNDEHLRIMTELVFRGELFQYHMFDSVEPAQDEQ
jgi:hypothetical protein